MRRRLRYHRQRQRFAKAQTVGRLTYQFSAAVDDDDQRSTLRGLREGRPFVSFVIKKRAAASSTTAPQSIANRTIVNRGPQPDRQGRGGICYDARVTTANAPSAPLDALARLAKETPALDLVMLFGSRARTDAHTGSDWDLAYLAAPGFDLAAFLGAVVEIVGTDRVDLVDLRRASGLLRYGAARDGRIVFEARPRLAERFSLDAAQFWCDAEFVLQRGYDDVLAGLKP